MPQPTLPHKQVTWDFKFHFVDKANNVIVAVQVDAADKANETDEAIKADADDQAAKAVANEAGFTVRMIDCMQGIEPCKCMGMGTKIG